MSESNSENAWRVFENVNAWIRSSDAKAVAVLTVNGVIIGSLSLAVGEGTTIAGVAAIVALGLTAASLVNAVAAINPTLDVGASDSIMYFAHIAKRTEAQGNGDAHDSSTDAFCNDFLRTTSNPEAMNLEIAHQVVANSQIAWKKFRRVAWAIRWCIGALTAASAFIALQVVQ